MGFTVKRLKEIVANREKSVRKAESEVRFRVGLLRNAKMALARLKSKKKRRKRRM